MRKFCNDCHFAEKHELTATTKKCYNWYCTNGSKKITNFSVMPNEDVPAPPSCPLNMLGNNDTDNTTKSFSELTASEQTDYLKKIKPLTAWKDIKVNELYHIPPINNIKRQDIIVTFISDYCLSYKVVNGNTYNAINTIYPSSVISRFIVKSKIKKYQKKTV